MVWSAGACEETTSRMGGFGEAHWAGGEEALLMGGGAVALPPPWHSGQPSGVSGDLEN